MMGIAERVGLNFRAGIVSVASVLLSVGVAACGSGEGADSSHQVAAASTAEVAQPEARPEDVATIDGIITAFYEVVSGPPGESPDQERDRTLHHPDAWVAIADVDSTGAPFVNVTPLDGYYGDNPPREEGFWEWETDRSVQQSANMVHVWSSYASAREEGGVPYTHGVNTITLWHDGERWWIMGWMFDNSAE